MKKLAMFASLTFTFLTASASAFAFTGQTKFNVGEQVYYASENAIWTVTRATSTSVRIDGPSIFNRETTLNLSEAKSRVFKLQVEAEFMQNGALTKGQVFTDSNGDFYNVKEVLRDGRLFSHRLNNISASANTLVHPDDVKSVGTLCLIGTSFCRHADVIYDGSIFEIMGITQDGMALLYDGNERASSFVVIDLRKNILEGDIDLVTEY